MKKRLLKAALVLAITALIAAGLTVPAFAAFGPRGHVLAVVGPVTLPENTPDAAFGADVGGGAGTVDPNINISINGEGSDTVRIILLMTVLTLLPSILLMMTSFTRIIIVFSLLRNAMGLQQTPPNQVLVGLALFLSLFIMRPVLTEVNETALRPYGEGTITTQQFVDTASEPLRGFMLRQTRRDDLNLFLSLGDIPRPETTDQYPMTVVIPAFVTSEIKTAFTIGFLIFIPFLIIDMVVASALMSMGMMMLPPVTISLPFKLMLFVLVDGWGLLIRTLVSTYN